MGAADRGQGVGRRVQRPHQFFGLRQPVAGGQPVAPGGRLQVPELPHLRELAARLRHDLRPLRQLRVGERAPRQRHAERKEAPLPRLDLQGGRWGRGGCGRAHGQREEQEQESQQRAH